MHGRTRMTIDPRIPTMPGRSMSGFHRPSRGGGGAFLLLRMLFFGVVGERGGSITTTNRTAKKTEQNIFTVQDTYTKKTGT